MDGKQIFNTQPPSQPWPVQANIIVHRCKESNPPNLFNIPSNEMKRYEICKVKKKGLILLHSSFGIRHLASISSIYLIINFKYIIRSIFNCMHCSFEKIGIIWMSYIYFELLFVLESCDWLLLCIVRYYKCTRLTFSPFDFKWICTRLIHLQFWS